MSRKNTIKKNLLSETVPQIIIMVLGLVKSKFFLDYLGSNVVGLTQIYVQIMAYLSIVEGGLGQAVIYRLYKPTANNDQEKISAIKNGTKKIFNGIILIIMLLSIVGGLIIPFLIKDNPFSIVFILANFILYVISEVVLYTTVFERSLYIATEKSYKANIIIKSSLIIKLLLEILLAILFKNITIIFIMLIIVSIAENVLIKVITNKDFKISNETDKCDTSIVKDIKNLIVHRIGGLIASNIDIILISKIIGLGKVLIYSTYLLYLNAVITLTNKISKAMVGTIGNLLIEDKKNSFQTFKKYNGFIFFAALIISGPFAFCINNFIDIFYSGQVATSSLTGALFTLILVYNIIRIPLITYTEGGGLFKETKICPIIESIVNLSLSLILIKYFGINGCLLGTFISLIVSEFIIKPRIILKKLFNEKVINYYKMSVPFIFLIIIQLILSSILQYYIVVNSFWAFLLYAIIYFILNTIIIIIIFKIFKQDYLFEWIKSKEK